MATRILKAVKSRIIKHSAGLKCTVYDSIFRASFKDKQWLWFFGSLFSFFFWRSQLAEVSENLQSTREENKMNRTLVL